VLDNCGIQQIMVDAEILGKAIRQSGLNAVINSHKIDDVTKLKNSGIKAKVICRINSFHESINLEIEQAINAGADILMFPMIQNIDNFKFMVEQVNNRVAILPLIETPYSIFKLKEIINIANPSQVHFGLNDLHLSLGMKNLFEVLLSHAFSSAVAFASNKVELIGIGGIGDPSIPQKINPSLLINEYKSLGSHSVILSRSFFTEGYEPNRILGALSLLESMVSEILDDSKRDELKYKIEKF
jgi:hypothetical protein